MNPELENIRSALWSVYYDLRDERITVEEAMTADEVCYYYTRCGGAAQQVVLENPDVWHMKVRHVEEVAN